MHRFLVPDLEPSRVRFTARQAHQLRSVLRLRSGDRVRVFDGVSPCDLVVELTEAGEGRVIERVSQAPEPRTRLVVYLSLMQRDKFEQMLQKLTEVGVAAIVPVLSERSLVRAAPDDARLTRWQAIVGEAAEQCGRGVVPALLPAVQLSSALDSAVAAGRTLVAYEGERTLDLGAALAGVPASVACFIGPEGGFSTPEIDLARGAGARVVTLGPRILRAETAAPVFAALVLFVLGDLSSW